MHLASLGLLMVIAPLHQLIRDQFPWELPLPDEYLQLANLCVFLWIVGYLGGRLASSLVTSEFRRPVPLLERQPSSVGLALGFLLALGSIAFLAAHGTAFIFTRAAFGSSFALEGVGQKLALIVRYWPVLALGAFLHTWILRPKRRTWWALGSIIVLALLGIIFNNPLAGPRTWTVTVLLGLGAIVYLSRLADATRTLPWLALALALLPALNQGRQATDFDPGMLTPQASAASEGLTTGDYDAYVNLVLANKYVELEGLAYGEQFAGALLFWFPRALWTEKPMGSGWVMAERIGLPHSNISMPLPGEALMDFGIWGLPFVAAGFGILLRWADARYYLNRPGAAPATYRILDVLYPFWLGHIIFLTRGDLLNGVYFMVGTTGAALMMLWPCSQPPQALRT
jgi:hypothetical protein